MKKSITGQGQEVMNDFLETMDAYKKDGKLVFIKLYANWCGHCKTMQSAWDALRDDNINFLEIEADAINKLNTFNEKTKTGAYKHLLKVDGGYPTIFLIDLNTNKRFDYKSNARTTAHMTKFILGHKSKSGGSRSGHRKKRRTRTTRQHKTRKYKRKLN